MKRFVSRLRTLHPDPGVLVGESSMTRGTKHAVLLHLDPPGVECLPRGAPRTRLALLVPLGTSLKALRHDSGVWSTVDTHKDGAQLAGFGLSRKQAELIHGYIASVHKLSRIDKKQIDQEKGRPLNAGWSSITQEHDETLNLDVARAAGDTIMKQSGPFSEYLNTLNLYGNNEVKNDHTRFGLSSKQAELIRGTIAIVHKLSRIDKKEIDKEKDRPLNAGCSSVTQEYDETLNLDVARVAGDTIMKQSGPFPEYLNTLNLSENNEVKVSSSDHTTRFGLSSKQAELIRGTIAIVHKLSRIDKKEIDKEKDRPLNAGCSSVTQEYDETLNLDVSRVAGDTIMKQSGPFPEYLNTLNLSENNEVKVSSSDHTTRFGLSSKQAELIRGTIAIVHKLSRIDKKEIDKEKDRPLNAGCSSVTQEYDETLNLDVSRVAGDTIMKQSGPFPEYLNTLLEEVTQQMLTHTGFPGSSNGTGLFQTILGLKIRDLYEQIVAERAAAVTADALNV